MNRYRGFQRRGFSEASLRGLVQAYRILFHSCLLRDEAMTRVEQELGEIQEVQLLTEWLKFQNPGNLYG